MKDNFNIWIGLRASDYQMFADLVEIDQIVSIDIDNTKGIPLISREAVSKLREPWSNDELLRVTEIEGFQTLCERIAACESTVNIYSYHSFAILEGLAREYKHIHVHSSPIELRDRLDDKLQFMELANTLDLPRIASYSETIDNLNFNVVAEKMGLPLVIKQKVGASGGQTYFVSTDEDFSKLQQTLRNETVIVSEYITGPSFNVNGFIGREGVYLDQPSFQIIGAPECATGRFTYCGNDFPSFRKHHQDITGEIKQITKKLGWYMKEIGYYGMFGIDFIYEAKKKALYPIEINPRMQGSTALLSRYQLANKASRLAELYVAEPESFFHEEPVDASFILLHNLSNSRLQIENSFASGIYRFAFSQDTLELTYRGDQTLFPTHKDELLLLGCPQRGTLIEPGAGIMRVEFNCGILNKQGNHLKKPYAKIARGLYNMLWK